MRHERHQWAVILAGGEGRRMRNLIVNWLGMTPADFSRDLLQRKTEKVTAAPLQGVTWSDWGRPKRIMDSLANLGKAPLFTEPLGTASDCASHR